MRHFQSKLNRMNSQRTPEQNHKRVLIWELQDSEQYQHCLSVFHPGLHSASPSATDRATCTVPLLQQCWGKLSLLPQNTDPKQSNGLQRDSRALNSLQGRAMPEYRAVWPKGRVSCGLAGQMPTTINSHRPQVMAKVPKNMTIFLKKTSRGERVMSKEQKGLWLRAVSQNLTAPHKNA